MNINESIKKIEIEAVLLRKGFNPEKIEQEPLAKAALDQYMSGIVRENQLINMLRRIAQMSNINNLR